MKENTMDEILDMMLGEPERPKMMDKPVPQYEHKFSIQPDSIRVSFEDGSTAIYDRRINQPAPVIVENIQIIRKWKQGYVNNPARRRRNRK